MKIGRPLTWLLVHYIPNKTFCKPIFGGSSQLLCGYGKLIIGELLSPVYFLLLSREEAK